MSDSMTSLQRKLASAGDLHSVVRSMKAVAASSIGQYEKSVQAVADYYRTVEMGLGACSRASGPASTREVGNGRTDLLPIAAIVFGSDQGLVGQFNEVVADHTITTLATLPGKPELWVVGERVRARLVEAGLPVMGLFPVPNSVKAIAPLVGRIQIASEAARSGDAYAEVHVFHNRPRSSAAYEPVSQRLLPFDAAWRQALEDVPWPTRIPPEIIGDGMTTLRALIRDYLFISIFRSCSESLASENSSRLAAMERADKNIKETRNDLQRSFNRLRQGSIDEELFDVIAGFESFGK